MCNKPSQDRGSTWLTLDHDERMCIIKHFVILEKLGILDLSYVLGLIIEIEREEWKRW